jgi:anaerobic selenocysteine-containing dehydrogenase
LTEGLKEAQAAGPGRVAVIAGQLPDHLYKIAVTLTWSLAGRGGGLPMDLGGPVSTGQGEAPYVPVVWNLQRACDGSVLLAGAMEEVFGEWRLPLFDLASADVVVSFAANMFETWLSPTYYGRAYGDFRRGGATTRGYMTQVESRLSSTAVSADEWHAPPPGREAEVALVLGKVILDEGLAAPGRPSGVDAIFAGVDARALAESLGLRFESLVQLARALGAATAPLAIPGGGLAGHTNAREAIGAVIALDLLVGADRTTLGLSPPTPVGEVGPGERVSSFAEVRDLARAMNDRKVDVLLVLDGDQLHDLPSTLGFRDAAAKVPLVVDFSPFPTDTGEALADLRLPSPTYLEGWGYQIPHPGTGLATLGAQQPVVRQYLDTRSAVDVLLAAAKGLGGEVAAALPWENEVAFLKEQVVKLAGRGDSSILAKDPDAFWTQWQQYGGWWSTKPQDRPSGAAAPRGGDPAVSLSSSGDTAARPFLLTVYPSLFLGEGRHANLPWMQVGADAMTTVMWESWVEVNPKVANDLGVETGDVVRVSSEVGSVEVPVYVYFGIGPDMVAMPLGQGHTHYGRYAAERGVDPGVLLTATEVTGQGELAWAATRVSLEKTGESKRLALLEGSDSTVVPEGL